MLPHFAVFQWLLDFVCYWINQSINPPINESTNESINEKANDRSKMCRFRIARRIIIMMAPLSHPVNQCPSVRCCGPTRLPSRPVCFSSSSPDRVCPRDSPWDRACMVRWGAVRHGRAAISDRPPIPWVTIRRFFQFESFFYQWDSNSLHFLFDVSRQRVCRMIFLEGFPTFLTWARLGFRASWTRRLLRLPCGINGCPTRPRLTWPAFGDSLRSWVSDHRAVRLECWFLSISVDFLETFSDWLSDLTQKFHKSFTSDVRSILHCLSHGSSFFSIKFLECFSP